MTQAQERQELIKEFSRITGLDVSRGSDARKLLKHAITLRKLYECSCNGCTREKSPLETWAQYDVARAQQMVWVDERIERIEALVKSYIDKLGLTLNHINQDPRGPAVYLTIGDKFNSWGGQEHGFGI